jgi:two-component system aerobic respiration control sensor histidine kinase ArcB
MMDKPGNSNRTKSYIIKRIREQEKIIEDLKHQIIQLDTENFQLKNLIDNLPGDIYWKDKEGVWSGVNKRGAQSLLQIGFIRDRSDVIGKSDYQLFSKETADEYRKNDFEVMSLKTEITREEINQLPNGKKIVQLSTKRPLWDKEGNVVGVVGNTIDISYLKKVEEELKTAIKNAEAANQAKTEFLENMRHDIRTPLTGIVGFAELLEMEFNDPTIREYVRNLVASSHALLDLLSEFLEAIRVSSGEIPKLKKKFSLKNALLQVINLNRAKAAQKRLSMTMEIDESIPPHVIGDRIRLHRVVLELIVNALNFTDKGFVKLKVSLAKQNYREIIIKLIVEDSGIGIPKERQQDIYVQFKRLTPSYQGIYKGAGLGLSVVKQFIDEMDGEIYLESNTGKGSCFICLIPLREPLLDGNLGIEEEAVIEFDKQYETNYAQEIKTPCKETEKRAYHILVVEDNTIAQIVAKSILKQMNCSADIAESGKKALDLWKANDYDLIFMDIGLPDMDGHEVTRHIRLQELTKNTHVPIIALTAHAGDENKKRCIDAGMNAVLIKPLTAKSCADIVDAFIPGRQKDAALASIPKLGIDLPDTEAELFHLDAYPLLDVDAGIKATNSKEMLIEMLKLLAEGELQSDVLLLKEAFAQNNEEKIQDLAHKIKGGAVYVGTIRMKMACQYLERYWKAGHRASFGKLYEQTIAVIEDTLREINQWLNHH